MKEFLGNEKVYCSNCNEKHNYHIEKEIRKEFRGQIVNVVEDIPKCEKCGNDIFVSPIENENLKRLYKKYSELTGTITAEEIIGLRNKYDISQRDLVSILGWGKMTINRYERGSLPNQSHSDYLKLLISNNQMLRDKVQEAYENGRISERLYEAALTKFEEIIINEEKEKLIKRLTTSQDIYNGFTKFDPEKLENLISYIADKVDNLYKTSLNKYLWFIDFKNFKENLSSITGLRYMKYDFGPIIEDYEYENIIKCFNDKFDKEEIECDYGQGIKTKIISKKNYDITMFSDEELNVINEVINKLKDEKCTVISRMSHKEDGWIQTPSAFLISYEFAETLTI